MHQLPSTYPTLAPTHTSTHPHTLTTENCKNEEETAEEKHNQSTKASCISKLLQLHPRHRKYFQVALTLQNVQVNLHK